LGVVIDAYISLSKPSWHCLLAPQRKALLSLVRATEWPLPQATSITNYFERASTFRGLASKITPFAVLVVLWPSWPNSFSPQEKTEPVFVTINACLEEQAILITAAFSSLLNWSCISRKFTCSSSFATICPAALSALDFLVVEKSSCAQSSNR
jgi:hypothetical protein